MRQIVKGAEPASLTAHRQTPHGDYDNYGPMNDLRHALVTEQRGLCCYCMGRIHNGPLAMKIEHWRCQSRHPAEQLSYRNLLGACLGGEGQPYRLQHCDTRKGESDLKWNPADPAHSIEQRVHYGIDGTIASSDADFNAQLKDVLGLNLPLLRNRRKADIDGLAAWLRDYRAKHHRGPDIAALRRIRAKKAPPTGRLEPFVQVAVWWLDQRLTGSAT